MPTYISFEINNTTHYLSFTEDFTLLTQITNNSIATLSPTTVNNIEFNAENTITAPTPENGMATYHGANGDVNDMRIVIFFSAIDGSTILGIEQNTSLSVGFGTGEVGSDPLTNLQLHSGTPPVTAGASGDPFITPLL